MDLSETRYWLENTRPDQHARVLAAADEAESFWWKCLGTTPKDIVAVRWVACAIEMIAMGSLEMLGRA